jgi:NhaP-type Na+/H+ or K+/H+ antiporter
VPFLLFFIALGSGGAQGEHARLTKFIIEQLGYGALVGLGIGGIGGWLLGAAQRRKWMAHSWAQLGVVALPLLLLASEGLAPACSSPFVAGLAVQVGFKDAAKHSVEFTEEWGQLFNLSVFFLFGLLVARDWSQFNATHAVYAILSLTVVRMLPVAIALIGTRLSRATVLFMGWFGPRGLASIVLGLVYLEQHTHQSGESTIRLAVMATVLLSIFAHGLSALPGMDIYARKISALPPDAAELAGSLAEIPGRTANPAHHPYV